MAEIDCTSLSALRERRAAGYSLVVLPQRLALCRLPGSAPIPLWIAAGGSFVAITRTVSELSIVVDEAAVPPTVRAMAGYRAVRVDGPRARQLINEFFALATPLAASRMAILMIATHDCDYVLVPETALARTIEALLDAARRDAVS